MKLERLPDWGFWGRDDCGRPDPEAGCGTIYQMGRADRQGGDEESAPEPIRRIDVRDCDFLDKLIANKIGRAHRQTICIFFYHRRPRSREDVDAAVRALLDAEYVARELGWAA